MVRIVGQVPLQATVYELERLRCNGGGQVFVAPEPEGVGAEKFDETAGAMIAQLKYGSGMPFARIEKLETMLGIPLPASTQWEVVEEVAEIVKPALEELTRQAADGEVVHNDDTGMRVLKMERPAGGQAYRCFHERDCERWTRAEDRAVFYRARARGRESGGGIAHRGAGLPALRSLAGNSPLEPPPRSRLIPHWNHFTPPAHLRIGKC